MTSRLRRRIGFELELLAPRGSSRQDLAVALASSCGGQVRHVWHQDSEPTPSAGFGGRFLHLTQGFEVVTPSGAPMCTLVDDITIVADLDPKAPAPPGWHRILTNDPRLLRLLARHSDPRGPLGTSLDVVAALWGETPEQLGSVWRLDSAGETVALAAPAGAERERPCEVVTPPYAADHAERLAELLEPARRLGFTVPAEAAVHLHLDGAPFREAAALANVVRLFAHWREPLRQLLGTNPRCRRLAPLPAALVAVVEGTPDLAEITAAAATGGLTKFFDVNLTQLLKERPLRDTLEVRILPGAIETADVVRPTLLVESLLDRCCDSEPIPTPPADPAAAVRVLQAMAQ